MALFFDYNTFKFVVSINSGMITDYSQQHYKNENYKYAHYSGIYSGEDDVLFKHRISFNTF